MIAGRVTILCTRRKGRCIFTMTKQGLPYIDLEQLGCMAAIMLMQNASEQLAEPEGVALVQTVRENYKGYTKREVLRAKEARCAQAKGTSREW